MQYSYNVPEFATTSDRELLLGEMVVTLTLGPDSLTTLSDDEPISWFDFFSLLGGAWGESAGTSGFFNFRADYVDCRYLSYHENTTESRLLRCQPNLFALRCLFHLLVC